MPRAQLAALVERQQQAGVQARESSCVSSSLPGCATGVGGSPVGRRRRRGRAPGSVWTPSPSMKVRYQSSRLSRLQRTSPPSARPACVVVEQPRDGGRRRGRARASRRSSSTSRSDVAATPPASTGQTARGTPSSAARGCSPAAGPRAASRRMRLVVKPRELAARRQRRRELHQHVIEERHAALDRRRHAHLVLLHQQLDQIRLDVRVEQAIEQRLVAAGRSNQAREAP